MLPFQGRAFKAHRTWVGLLTSRLISEQLLEFYPLIPPGMSLVACLLNALLAVRTEVLSRQCDAIYVRAAHPLLKVPRSSVRIKLSHDC